MGYPLSFSAFADDNSRFVQGTYINGVKVGGMNVEGAGSIRFIFCLRKNLRAQ